MVLSTSSANHGRLSPSTRSLVGSPLTCHTPSFALRMPIMPCSMARLLSRLKRLTASSRCRRRRSVGASFNPRMWPTNSIVSRLPPPPLRPRFRVDDKHLSPFCQQIGVFTLPVGHTELVTEPLLKLLYRFIFSFSSSFCVCFYTFHYFIIHLFTSMFCFSVATKYSKNAISSSGHSLVIRIKRPYVLINAYHSSPSSSRSCSEPQLL